MTQLSNKKNTELKKLIKEIEKTESEIGKTASQYRIKIKNIISFKKNKIKNLKNKIKEVKKLEYKKAIQIDKEKIEEIKIKIKKMKDIEQGKIKVKTAEIIARYNDGVLPPPLWLQNNRFSDLQKFIRENPKMFKHIKQNKRQKTVLQHVKFAEKLAEENGGVLPYAFELRRSGHISLNICMKKYPKAFSHIVQEKVQRKPKEWLEIAEKIMEENNGTLYSQNKMRELGHAGLFSRMRRYPKMFKHIKKNENMNRKGRNLKDWLEIAEKIMKENNGTLYSYNEMKKRGYRSIFDYMKRYPKEFKHVKQVGRTEYNRKRTEKAFNRHLKSIKKLMKENNGKLLSLKSILRYDQTLHIFIKRHPEKFEKFIQI